MTTNADISKPTPTVTQSDELNKLNSDRSTAIANRDRLADSQDSWHKAYLLLGAIGAVLVIASWVSQRMESSRSYDQRPLTERISKIDARIAAINDEISRTAIAEAGAKASAADERAKHEELERMKLEAEIQPRQYSQQEADAIASACKPFHKNVVVIRSLPYDVEGAVFANFLGELLRKKTDLSVDTSMVGNNFLQNLPMVMDVHVSGPASERDLVNALSASLATPRVRVEAPTIEGPRVRILVGAKRPPPIK